VTFNNATVVDVDVVVDADDDPGALETSIDDGPVEPVPVSDVASVSPVDDDDDRSGAASLGLAPWLPEHPAGTATSTAAARTTRRVRTSAVSHACSPEAGRGTMPYPATGNQGTCVRMGERYVGDPRDGGRHVEERVVERVGDPVVEREVVAGRRVVTNRRVDPAAVLAVVVGIALTVIGAVAVIRAGVDDPIDEPVVDVAGTSHTAVLGFIEAGMGLLTIWAGVSRDRGAILFVSLTFGVAALVAAIEPDVGGDALAIERSWAILLVVAFAVVALVAAIAPSVWRSTDRIERI